MCIIKAGDVWDERRADDVYAIPREVLEPAMGFDVFGIVREHVPLKYIRVSSVVDRTAILQAVSPRTQPNILVLNQSEDQIFALVTYQRSMGKRK